MSLKFVMTCGACPEQYDVFDELGSEIGYVRLRHGYFYVDGPAGETVFSRSFPVRDAPYLLEPEELDLPDHDSDGIFDGQKVREAYLTIASRKINEALGRTDTDGVEFVVEYATYY